MVLSLDVRLPTGYSEARHKMTLFLEDRFIESSPHMSFHRSRRIRVSAARKKTSHDKYFLRTNCNKNILGVVFYYCFYTFKI
jgi:hypothetical protein